MIETKLNLCVTNETASLKTVILGIGDDRGEVCGINPLIRKHIKEGTLPTDEAIFSEISSFENVLKQAGVEVIRPENISKTEQIFTRDIGFVIDDLFFVSNMKHPVRSKEYAGIKQYIDNVVDPDKIIDIPQGALAEGGDVILYNNYIFIGVGERTNWAGVEFIQNRLPHKKVIGLDLQLNENDPSINTLHLDCIFQPIGTDEAIIYKPGFKNEPTEILKLFSEDKLIHVTQVQKDEMYPNVISISPTQIVIERSFTTLKEKLEARNYTVYEVDYLETSKFNGLLRCSTLPLVRTN